MRRFLSYYAKIVDEITNMLKKENEVNWTKEARESFSRIKEALQAAPVLINPDYQKPFQVFSFASSSSIAVVYYRRMMKRKSSQLHSSVRFLGILS